MDVARLDVGSRVDAVARVLIEANAEVEALGRRGTSVGGVRSNDKVDRAVDLDLCMMSERAFIGKCVVKSSSIELQIGVVRLVRPKISDRGFVCKNSI
jgi:hypothetical protein